ncbi:MAG: MiaB/RimO family radical SAM methylthiotransferase [Candidatus Shapirobacteria bacterium]|nr:MiaB/RimO family radical SAM methylthiotransferase [Candidatus Shapirobacteria bacterium]
MKNKTYFIKTFGCQMNVSDEEMISGWYKEKGWQAAKLINRADEIIIISCSVRQTAEDRVYGLINNLKKLKKNPEGFLISHPKIILTGCMLRYPLRWLKEKMPVVDEFIKIEKFKTKKIIRKEKLPALVSIMEGCNQFCSYCVVPYARGREKSRPFKEIVCEIKKLAQNGCQEVMLLGQNVNSYGKDLKKNNNFAELLKTIHRIEGIKKIAFFTSNPWDLSQKIIEALKLPKIDRYLHLPVQSGDDDILKKMNRHYTAKDYLTLVKNIKKEIPDIKIGTDIIVGFPGETEGQFKNTLNLCKKVGFVKAYVSMYSPRPQTKAYQLEDDVPLKEKRRRWKILDDLIN